MLGRLAIVALGAAAVWAQPPGGGPGGGSGDGIWTRNAAFGEAETFDLCNGHQPGSGMYHHHVNPICLRAQLNDNVVAVASGRLGTQYAEKPSGWTHSPILGWAFDGYPVYGPYGYSSPSDAKSAIKRVQPGFRLRAIAQRHTLPDGTEVAASQYGPDVNDQFPLGRYVQDYEYVAGLGDLDEFNGRFTVTPEYPNGVYAYFVTLSPEGVPKFPYILGLQFYGAPATGNATVAADSVDYFANGALAQAASTDPRLASWSTKGSQQNALAITGFDPSAGASTTWPVNVPSGVTVSGGNRTPALADVQRLRYDASAVFVNSNNLPSYTMGPWFEATMTGGVFLNWASSTSRLVEITRTPAVGAAKTATGLGPVGMWVNGVAIFNTLDGGSYSNAAKNDQGGGGVSARATHVSAASGERGPLAAGSLVSAYAEFNAVLAAPGQTATVMVTDSTGAQLPANVLYSSAAQVNYQMPANAAPGAGRVTITSGGNAVSGTVNIAATYPGLFSAVQTVAGASGEMYLVLYGTGIGTAATTATVGGTDATVTYSGAQGTYAGLDQVNVLVPAALVGKGKQSVVVTSGGKRSNAVDVVIP